MTGRGALRAATIALFATAVRVAPATAYAQDLECDRGDLEVRALEFRGNQALSDDDLALRVLTTPSAWGRRHLNLWFSPKRCLDHNALARDVLGLRNYYRVRGYYSAQVDTLVEPTGRDAVRVVFNISEGQPTLVQSYTVTGLDTVPTGAEISRDLRLRVGQPFDLSLFTADIDTIVQRLRNVGYYRATTLHSYDREDSARVARASIEVLPGKRVRFGDPQILSVGVEGRPANISESVVRRVFGITAGDPYSDRAIVEAQRNLFQMGAYQHIEVEPLPDSLQPSDTVVVLQLRLSEDYMRQLDSEFGWATLDCGRIRLQYTDKNLFGTGRRMELTGQASKIGFGDPVASHSTRELCALGGPIKSDSEFSSKLHYYTGIALRQPRLLGTRWAPTVTLYSERRGEYRAYLRTTEVGGDFAATRDVADRTQLRLGYTIEYGQTKAPDAAFCALFNRCDPQSRDILSRLATLGVASATVVRLRTDNVINPSSGLAMRGEVRSSASKFLGTSDSLFFNKGTGDVAWYHPFGYRSVLSLRLRGGLVLGRRLSFSDSGVFVPPQERLYAGGPTSVRGFQQNELGSLVYIARPGDIDTLDASGSRDPTCPTNCRLEIKAASNGPERVVPLGGNSLVVANIEYRLRDPFFFPDVLQYSFFVDGGDVWSRGIRGGRLKWTPGFGIRVLTPVGPVQANIGWNRYTRDDGAIYYNPDVTTLQCVSPGNPIRYDLVGGVFVPTGATALLGCPQTYIPPPRVGWQRLVFTFSIGPDF